MESGRYQFQSFESSGLEKIDRTGPKLRGLPMVLDRDGPREQSLELDQGAAMYSQAIGLDLREPWLIQRRLLMQGMIGGGVGLILPTRTPSALSVGR